MKRNIISFKDFLYPYNDFKKYINKNIDINDIKNVSYVKYIIISLIDGEISDDYNVYDDINIVKEKYFEENVIYAINCIDNIVCEVI